MKKMLKGIVAAALALCLSAAGYAAELDDGDAIITHDGWVPTTEVLMWRNVRLADLTDFSALMWGGSVYQGWVIKNNQGGRLPYQQATGFTMSNDGENAFVQFRQFSGATIWCVKVQFIQRGADVYAKAIWARYHQNQSSINVDMETSYAGNSGVAASSTAGGYGVYQVTARVSTRAMPSTTIACNATRGFLKDSGLQLLWKNAYLTDMQNLNAWMGGGSMSRQPATSFVTLYNDGLCANVQFRYFTSGTIWCVKARLYQNGSCIYGIAGYAKYANGQESIESVDFDNGGNLNGAGAASDFTAGGYGVYQLSADFGKRNPFFTGVCTSFLLTSERLIWHNVPLARVRNVRGVAGGGSSNYTPALEQHRTFTDAGQGGEGDTLDLQMSYADAGGVNFRCVKVHLEQRGNDVYGKALWAKYVQNNVLSFDYDNGGNTISVAEPNYTATGYGISRLQGDILPATEGANVVESGNDRLVLLGAEGQTFSNATVTGSLIANGSGPLTLEGDNAIGTLAFYGICSALRPSSGYWFLNQGHNHVSEFQVEGNGNNMIGHLAWPEITALDKRDSAPQIGISLSGTNTFATPFLLPDYTFLHVKSGRTSLPELRPMETSKSVRFAVDSGAELAIGGYVPQEDKPAEFYVRGTLDVAGTMTTNAVISATAATLKVGAETMIEVAAAPAAGSFAQIFVKSDDPTYQAWREGAVPFMKGPNLTENMVAAHGITCAAGKRFAWKMTIEDEEGETGLKIAKLSCIPNQFMIIVR